jgi:DNA-directed RNA polymerase beta subunit
MEKVNAIIESLLTDPLSHVQTDSYRGCIENTIPRVLRQFNPIALQYKVNDATGKEVVVKVNVYVGSVKKDGAILDNGQGVFFATPSVIRGGKDDSEEPKASPMFPNEARLRDFTYETEISANVHI